MFDAIKNWFSPAKELAPESQWDSRTVQVQQPNSPATMNDSVNQQPVRYPQQSTYNSILSIDRY